MSKTILIVDDDKLIREGLTALLKNAGQTVIEAANGREGLDSALAHHPDLVVSDVRMPEMTGLEMIEALRADEWGKQVPIVMLTNDNTNDSVNQALQSGITIYLEKNLPPSTLSQQILELVGE